VGKRVVKSPKVYIQDTGILHALLGIATLGDLSRHPKLGASWEGFVVSQVIRKIGTRPDECYFWATHNGAELDLVVVSGGRRLGFEIKRTDTPHVTSSMKSAMQTLGLKRLDMIHAGRHTFPLGAGMRAIAARDLLQSLKPIRLRRSF
jgi:hypothetical protein